MKTTKILCLFFMICLLFWSLGCDMQVTSNPITTQDKPVQVPELSRATLSSYNYYYGALHNHTAYSDGKGTPAEAYSYARDVAKLDFIGLADHAWFLDDTEWADLKNQADDYNQDGVFTTFRGFEWGSQGHVAVVNSNDYCKEDVVYNFSKLVDWLNERDCIAFFNHPGREDEEHTEFNHFLTTPTSKIVGMELWNKNNGFEDYYYNDGYVPLIGYGYYDEALTLGWKIGASGGFDDHNATWGTATDSRLCILSNALTRDALYRALQARRFFSTSDKNLKLFFEIGGNVMGSTIDAGIYNVKIQAADGDNEKFTKVELMLNGMAIKTWDINCTNPQLSCLLVTIPYASYYVIVTQEDKGKAISSPVYTSGLF